MSDASTANPCYFRNPVPGFGFELIHANAPATRVLASIGTAQLYDDLAHSGVVIYRGFGDSLHDFNEFVARHSARLSIDPARHSPNIADIEVGSTETGLHCENGSLPFNPDLQWFYCLAPARIASETALCNGQRVLFDLGRDTRKMFEKTRIKYTRRIPWHHVRRFLSIELQLPESTVTDAHLDLVNEAVEGQYYRRIDQNLIHTEIMASALSTSRFSGRMAFCNAMLGASPSHEPPRISWENGDQIDIDIWDEIKAITSRHTFKLFWQQGDIVVIDNGAVMHGQRAPADPARRIFAAQSYRLPAVPRARP